MERNTLGEVMGISMTKMKEMVNVNTIIGDPIYTPDGITLIPVTQVSMGMGAGGADSMGKNVTGAYVPQMCVFLQLPYKAHLLLPSLK